ncbi:GTP 3',8-cyclase MoaA [Glaciecola sp. MH2013]|uniref:GTP 3',8-cyclase MoaA n=1 Tax=Glaciecola sp. MH2013 TaxID=2785524 RepID=UPI0018A0F2A6|nr:GTP 3',8-cyclase MoaA [Glaciecola sp. MH2013]MBF7073731.1 GTP 3',8-cyclase MoaA [Glaciecola sp. MH2013]
MDTFQNTIPFVDISRPSIEEPVQSLTDKFGRRFEYLRLSITDVCNFSCQYCLPDGYQCNTSREFLNQDELLMVVKAFAQMGTKKVRITGGEPSLRKDLVDIIRQTAQVDGIEQVAITTNGFKLEKDIDAWVDAGLSSLNVSVDSLDARQFEMITGDGRLQSILRGVDKAIQHGLQVKLNAVLLKSLADHQLPMFLNYVKHNNLTLRFIELMQTGDNKAYFDAEHVRGEEIEARLAELGWVRKTKAQWAGPAKVYRHHDYEGRIGLIMPYSKDFCADCNRLRISSLGKLHLCLFAEKGLDLRELINKSIKQHAPQLLVEEIRALMGQKHATHYLDEGYAGATQHLAMLGG